MVKFSPDPGPTSDAELIAAMGRGDVEAFDELYRRHRDWVLRLAWRFTHDERDTLSVLRETFVELLSRPPRLALWAKLTTYLYPAVKKVATTLRPRREKDQPLERVAAYTAAEAPPAPDDLSAMLTLLPEEQREVLVMRFVDDMSPEEIAHALGISLGTARSCLRAAVARLRADPGVQKRGDR